ncbi:DNA-directed DNA polymerase [Sorochytrium milnesiophthora]
MRSKPVRRELPKTILEFFWDLASVEEDVRLKASTALLAALASFQASFEEEHAVQIAEAVAEEDQSTLGFLEKAVHKDVLYTVKRLVKGLQSGRLAARQGFSVTLTELIRLVPVISYKHICSLVDSNIKMEGDMTGEEERDVWLGRIFAMTAVVNSGILLRDAAQVEDLEDTVKRLAEAATAKEYLGEMVISVISDLLQQARVTSLADTAAKSVAAALIKDSIDKPDQLAAAFLVEQVSAKHLQPAVSSWPNKSTLLHADNLQKLQDVLMESTGCHPRIHSVWGCIIPRILQMDNAVVPVERDALLQVRAPASCATAGLLQKFWRLVVDDGFFQSTHERKFLGFGLFHLFTHYCHESDIPLMFTPEFLRCYMNNLGRTDNMLNEAAKATTQTIQHITKEQPAIAVPVMSHLLGPNGSKNFDEVTKSNTIESILSKFSDVSVMDYIAYLESIIYNQGESASEAEDDFDSNAAARQVHHNRLWAADSLVHMTNLKGITLSEAALERIAQVLLSVALFQPKSPEQQQQQQPAAASKKSKKQKNKGAAKDTPDQNNESSAALTVSTATPEFGADTRSQFMTRLWTMTLNTSATTAGTTATASPLAAAEKSMQRAHRTLQRMLSSPQLSLVQEMSSEQQQLYDATAVTINAIERELESGVADERKQGHIRAFHLLFLLCAVQLFSPEATEETTDVLAELRDCYERVLGKGVAQSNEPQPADVIMDILLSFLSKSSAILRKLSDLVFRVFCDQMSANALDLFLNVLQTSEDVSGQDDLYDDEDDDDDDDDVEMIDAPEDHASGKTPDDGSASESEEDGEDDEDEDGGEVDEELRRKLEEALGAAKANEEDDSDMESLGDEDMAGFDAKLSEIFRAKKMEHNMKRDAKQNVLHFKYRVLDLLDTFVRKQGDSPLMLRLLSSCLSIISTIPDNRSTQPLLHKITALTQSIFKSSKHPNLGAMPADSSEVLDAEVLLKDLFESIPKVKDNGVALQPLGAVIAYTAKCMQPKDTLVKSLLAETFEAAVGGKRTRAVPVLYQPVIDQQPALTADALLVPMVRSLSTNSSLLKSGHHQQMQEMLKSLTAKLAAVKSTPETLRVVDAAVAETVALLTAALSGSKAGDANQRRIKDSIGVVSLILRLAKKQYGDAFNAKWPLSDVEQACKSVENVDSLATSTRSALNSLLQTMGSRERLVGSKSDKEAKKAGKKDKKAEQAGKEDKKAEQDGDQPSKKAKKQQQSKGDDAAPPAKAKADKPSNGSKPSGDKKRKLDAGEKDSKAAAKKQKPGKKPKA